MSLLRLLDGELGGLLDCFFAGGLGDGGGEEAGLDNPVVLEIEHLEVALGIDGEGDRFCFAGLERHALEAAQHFVEGSNGADFVFDVKLHHVVAVLVSAVSDVAGEGDFVVGGGIFGGDGEGTVFEGGVAEPVSERIEGAAHAGGAPAIGVVTFALSAPSAVAMREGERDLTGALWEGDGEFASGVVVAEEGFGDRLPDLFAAMPCAKDAGNVLVDPIAGNGATGHENHDDGLAGFDEFLHEEILVAGEVEAETGFGFAYGVMGVADVGDDEVGLFRHGESFVDFRLILFVGSCGENV